VTNNLQCGITPDIAKARSELETYQFDESKYVAGVHSLYADGVKAGQASRDEFLRELKAIAEVAEGWSDGETLYKGVNELILAAINEALNNEPINKAMENFNRYEEKWRRIDCQSTVNEKEAYLSGHKDGVKAGQASRDDLVERLRQEAQMHAMEARTANGTLNQIYQLCSGAKGEKGNWNGALPVRDVLANRDALLRECSIAIGKASREAALNGDTRFFNELMDIQSKMTGVLNER
jgi:hypothetical protein